MKNRLLPMLPVLAAYDRVVVMESSFAYGG